MNIRLQIDPEFRELIPPLKDEEFEQLEKNVLEEGIRDAIVTWNGVILDGHNRYKIAQKHDIPLVEMPMTFANRNEAKDWMIDNQLGRRNLEPNQRDYLIGLRYRDEKSKDSFKGNQYTENSGGGQNVTHQKTSDRIGEQYGIICVCIYTYAHI